MSGIEELGRQAMVDIAAATTPEALEALRVSLLGKAGSITAQLKSLGTLPADERKAAGEAINRARDAIGDALAARRQALESAALDARLATETIDVTLPGRNGARGGLHPVSRTLERIAGIFGRLGYELADGPEIEEAAVQLRLMGVNVDAVQADLATPDGVDALYNKVRQSGRP